MTKWSLLVNTSIQDRENLVNSKLLSVKFPPKIYNESDVLNVSQAVGSWLSQPFSYSFAAHESCYFKLTPGDSMTKFQLVADIVNFDNKQVEVNSFD